MQSDCIREDDSKWSDLQQHRKYIRRELRNLVFQHILISSSLPKSPIHLFLPQIIIATIHPLHVSISTSLTHPSLQPVFEDITSLLRRSVIQQFIYITSVYSIHQLKKKIIGEAICLTDKRIKGL